MCVPLFGRRESPTICLLSIFICSVRHNKDHSFYDFNFFYWDFNLISWRYSWCIWYFFFLLFQPTLCIFLSRLVSSRLVSFVCICSLFPHKILYVSDEYIFVEGILAHSRNMWFLLHRSVPVCSFMQRTSKYLSTYYLIFPLEHVLPYCTIRCTKNKKTGEIRNQSINPVKCFSKKVPVWFWSFIIKNWEDR